MTIKHEFVEFIPDELANGTLYISIAHRTAIHSCMCGCGEEIVTPISPTDWHLTFDGQTVSLYPSIGNWSYPCRSHYWIKKGKVVWSTSWTPDEIAEGRDRDKHRKREYYGSRTELTAAPPSSTAKPDTRLMRFLRWIREL